MLKLYLCVTILTSIQSFVEVLSFSPGDSDADITRTDDLIEKIFNTTNPAFTGKHVNNSTVNLRMVTPCETPNNNLGLCLGIKQCPNLLSLLTNQGAWEFLRASMCRPFYEDKQNPKVCCVEVVKSTKQAKQNNADDSKILPKKCGKQRRTLINSRILGGTEAALGEFPWMARLEHKNKRGSRSFGCSGFLISSKYVVTAAHCVDNKFVQVRGPVHAVILGEHDSESKIDCDVRNRSCADLPQISRVANVIVHPRYDSDSSAHYNDIALIQLKKGARATEYVQPICLLTDPNVVFKGYSISGWGMTSESGELSPVKMKVEVPAADRNECVERYSTVGIDLVDAQICAGGEGGKDSCGGDSGGPLMALQGDDDGDAARWYAVGVVSFGLGCGVEEWPGVYTSVRDFVPWIRRKIVETDELEVKGPKKNGKKKRQQHRSTE